MAAAYSGMSFQRFLTIIEKFGPPVSIAAWLSVFGAAIVLGIVLRGSLTRKVWIPALIVGVVSLAAHLLDYVVTLHVSPDLALEANPIWRIVIDHYGLAAAKLYGLTGKILLSILSFEFFAYYLIQRERLAPEKADDFLSFWKHFGSGQAQDVIVRWNNMVNLFSFTFALLGPFYFYIAFINGQANNPLHYKYSFMLFVLFVYLAIVLSAYFIMTYRFYQICLKSFDNKLQKG